MSYLSKTLGVRVNGPCSKSRWDAADCIKASLWWAGLGETVYVIANFNTDRKQ